MYTYIHTLLYSFVKRLQYSSNMNFLGEEVVFVADVIKNIHFLPSLSFIFKIHI